MFRSPVRRAMALATAAAVALVLATPAIASADTPGGTPGAPVPLPIGDFDSSFTATNADVTSLPARPGQPYWNNVTWYSVTPSATTRVFIRATSISPSGWDNTLEVWAGSSLVVQNDDFYGLDAAVTVTLDAGTSYLIGLGGYHSGSKGSVTLTFASRVPSAPLDVAATQGDSHATVTWNAPSDLAGGVTSYRVLCTPAGGSESECGTVGGTPPATYATITGLTNGTDYTFRVEAANVLGYGAPSAPTTTTTPKAVPSVTVSTSPASPVSGQPFAVSVDVTAGGSPAPGTVQITVDGVTTTGIALVDGHALVDGITHAAGTVPVGVAYSGTSAVAPGSASQTVTVAKRSQTITLAALPTGKVYASAPVAVSATSSEALPVTLAATGACSLAGSSLSFTGVGTCTVTASQAGTSEVEAADATVAATVGQRPQTLTVAALPAMVYGQRVTPAATSSVGLTVGLSASGACALDAGELVATGVGQCTLTATQPGTATTAAATAVTRTQTVGKRPQAVTLSDLPLMTFLSPVISVVASSEYGLPVTVSGEGACSVVDGELRAIGAGLCTVTATAAGDDVTEPGAAVVSGTVTGPPTDVVLQVKTPLGAKAAAAPVAATASGLQPGSELVLEVHSTPVVIGRAVVGPDGTATVTGTLPVLEPGDHHLVAIGTGLDGQPVTTRTSFAVDTDGAITRIENRTLPGAALAATGGEARTVVLLAVMWIALGSVLILVRRSARWRATRAILSA
ncbi:fibronectin type III domain-containing protein [Actinotalea subterranea]|uniref:fibronectin type III domain-containing protein n=1 Tax=Actinotalea subterranea TaxID=2607497 RepID=UPI0011EE9812|nr:fibronectin type III domain-containing protein [Actinotalea subterranea]